MVKKLQQFSLEAVYLAALADINLNTCGDPDCGNYGVAPDFTPPVFKGPGAQQRKQQATSSIAALSYGRGVYTMSSDDSSPRILEAFQYHGDPVGWDDGRSMKCGHRRGNGNGNCGISFTMLSNEHFPEEWKRLETVNGLLEGPVCGHCGTRYLDRPEEFIFNGTDGKLKSGGNRRKFEAIGVPDHSPAVQWQARSSDISHPRPSGPAGATRQRPDLARTGERHQHYGPAPAHFRPGYREADRGQPSLQPDFLA